MMIKVTKYTQGHLYPTASFTWVETWRHGTEERRQKGWRKEKDSRDESKEGAIRNVRREERRGRG